MIKQDYIKFSSDINDLNVFFIDSNHRNLFVEKLKYISFENLIENLKMSKLFNIEKSKFEYKSTIYSDDIINVHTFSSRLNSILLSYSLHIEVALKEKVSYIIARDNGVWTNPNDASISIANDYLNEQLYSDDNG